MLRKALILFLCCSGAAFAESKPKLLRQFGAVDVLFDMKRVVIPYPVTQANNPPTWRAYLPSCPPGAKYINGVNPNLLELDQSPNYYYCLCICQGQCSNLPGVTSTGGKLPIYSAYATCTTKAEGLFTNSVFAMTPTHPHEYYYCQSGNCATHPLPAEFDVSVPTGGYENTVKVDFLACNIAYIRGCGAPDGSAMSKQTGVAS